MMAKLENYLFPVGTIASKILDYAQFGGQGVAAEVAETDECFDGDNIELTFNIDRVHIFSAKDEKPLSRGTKT